MPHPLLAERPLVLGPPPYIPIVVKMEVTVTMKSSEDTGILHNTCVGSLGPDGSGDTRNSPVNYRGVGEWREIMEDVLDDICFQHNFFGISDDDLDFDIATNNALLASSQGQVIKNKKIRSFDDQEQAESLSSQPNDTTGKSVPLLGDISSLSPTIGSSGARKDFEVDSSQLESTTRGFDSMSPDGSDSRAEFKTAE